MLESLLKANEDSKNAAFLASEADQAKNLENKISEIESRKNFIDEIFEASSVASGLVSCPGCGGGDYWSPKFQNGVWKCSKCEPPPSPVLVQETRKIDATGFVLPYFDPYTLCMGREVCKECRSTHLEVSMDGYRCGSCGGSVGLSAVELFFAPPLEVQDPKERKSRLML